MTQKFSTSDEAPKEALFNLLESLEAANSSIKASEKWAEKLAKNLGCELDKAKLQAQETRPSLEVDAAESSRTVEGIFDGQNMVDAEGTVYPVPANYASKSKLVEGDHLKLIIAENGAFIYKQVELVERELLVGHLVIDGSQYQVLADKKVYNVLYASVTFYRARVGDQVTIIVPTGRKSKHAAIENVIPQSVVEKNARPLSEIEI